MASSTLKSSSSAAHASSLKAASTSDYKPLSSADCWHWVYENLHGPDSSKSSPPSETPVALAQSSAARLIALSKTHLGANVVDTLVLKKGVPQSWTFTSKEGLVMKKRVASLNWPTVLRNFNKNVLRSDPAKTGMPIAILRFSSPLSSSSPSTSTFVVSGKRKLSSLFADLDEEQTNRLQAIQMYAAGSASPDAGVFICNYMHDAQSGTVRAPAPPKYTSVQCKSWPRQDDLVASAVMTRGQDKENDPYADPAAAAADADLYSAVLPWRHNSLSLASRTLVSFLERNAMRSVLSATFEFVFDASNAQPVLLGVVEMQLGDVLQAPVGLRTIATAEQRPSTAEQRRPADRPATEHEEATLKPTSFRNSFDVVKRDEEEQQPHLAVPAQPPPRSRAPSFEAQVAHGPISTVGYLSELFPTALDHVHHVHHQPHIRPHLNADDNRREYTPSSPSSTGARRARARSAGASSRNGDAASRRSKTPPRPPPFSGPRPTAAAAAAPQRAAGDYRNPTARTMERMDLSRGDYSSAVSPPRRGPRPASASSGVTAMKSRAAAALQAATSLEKMIRGEQNKARAQSPDFARAPSSERPSSQPASRPSSRPVSPESKKTQWSEAPSRHSSRAPSRNTSPEPKGNDMRETVLAAIPPVDLDPKTYSYADTTQKHICRGKYCNLLFYEVNKSDLTSSVTMCVSFRSIALAKAEEKFDGEISLNERYAALLADLGVAREAASDELELVKDVVDRRLKRIMAKIQAESMKTYSLAMGANVGVGISPLQLHEVEILARKTIYNKELKHIAPQRAYDQVPVCGRCFFTYNLLDRRREVMYANREADIAPPANRPVGTGVSAVRQWRASKKHAAGLGRQHIDSLTVTEKNAAAARKKLLLKQEKELLEMARRVAAAKAKTQSMYVYSSALPRRQRSTNGSRGGEAFYNDSSLTEQQLQQHQQLALRQEQQHQQLALTAPQNFDSVGTVTNSALVVTSGQIGFDGVNFVFKPPKMPKQLALSDVRRAGFDAYAGAIADRIGGAVLSSDSQQFHPQQFTPLNINVVVGRKPQTQLQSQSQTELQTRDLHRGPPADVVTQGPTGNLHASLSNETLTNVSANEAHPSLDFLNDEDVFDVLKPSNRASDDGGQNFLGVDLGLESNDYLTNYDVGAFFPGVGSASQEILDFAMGRNGNYGFPSNGDSDFNFLPDEFAGFEGDLDDPFAMIGEERAIYEEAFAPEGFAFDGGLSRSTSSAAKSTNFTLQSEMRSELDDLKAFKAQLDKKVGVKKKQEPLTPPKTPDPSSSQLPPAQQHSPSHRFPDNVSQKLSSARTGDEDGSDGGNSEQATGANEYAEDFFDDREESGLHANQAKFGGSASNEPQWSEPQEKEVLLGCDDDFAAIDVAREEIKEPIGSGGFGFGNKTANSSLSSTDAGGRKTLQGLGLAGEYNVVPLGVISGGVEAQRPNSRQGSDGEKRPLPSAAFLNEIAELKASALKLNKSFGPF